MTKALKKLLSAKEASMHHKCNYMYDGRVEIIDIFNYYFFIEAIKDKMNS